MTVLLDENFPLALLRALLADGEAAEHIITLGLRGASDQAIRERLLDTDVLFLTQDEDFLFSPPCTAAILLSRVRQSRGVSERVGIWLDAVRRLRREGRAERRFELMDSGYLQPWHYGPQGVWLAK